VARCAANIIKVYFKNEKKPICIEIFIPSLKYTNIFLILYTKCARKCLCALQCAANRKSLRIKENQRVNSGTVVGHWADLNSGPPNYNAGVS
jgi:hypothetical protein